MKVSVIVPSYNYGHFISETLNSVLRQTYKEWECIIVDDGSTDNTREVVQKYVKRDHRYKYIYQKNKGLAGARNTGILNTSGEYVQLLDADDLLHPEKIRLQLNFCLTQKSLISYCETAQFSDNISNQWLSYVGPVSDMFYQLYNLWVSYPVPVHSLLIKRVTFERYGLFDESLKAHEDRFFFSKLAIAGIKFDYFPFVGAYRRRHKENMTKKIDHITKYGLEYYRKMRNEVNDAFFVDRYGFTQRQLMNANMTYIYLSYVASGIKRGKLSMIKNTLSKNGMQFTIEAIPDYIISKNIPCRYLYYLLKCYCKRYIIFLERNLRNLFPVLNKNN